MRKRLRWWAVIGPAAEMLMKPRAERNSDTTCICCWAPPAGDSLEFSDRCQRLPHASRCWRPLNKGSSQSAATCTAANKRICWHACAPSWAISYGYYRWLGGEANFIGVIKGLLFSNVRYCNMSVLPTERWLHFNKFSTFFYLTSCQICTIFLCHPNY